MLENRISLIENKEKLIKLKKGILPLEFNTVSAPVFSTPKTPVNRIPYIKPPVPMSNRGLPRKLTFDLPFSIDFYLGKR